MEKVQKVVLSRDTNSIIFLFSTFTVAFTYRGFIFDNRPTRGTAIEQFIKEFATNEDGVVDHFHMSQDVQTYNKSSLDFYDDEVNHKSAVVVYTLKNGFGVQ